MSRFGDFTNEELYMLKRQAMEGSYEILMEDGYTNEQQKTHQRLLNEIIDAIKMRDNN